nr:lysine-rich arabinogalactan protein 19-like [Aegilops tauschii subsp. strangulata]
MASRSPSRLLACLPSPPAATRRPRLDSTALSAVPMRVPASTWPRCCCSLSLWIAAARAPHSPPPSDIDCYSTPSLATGPEPLRHRSAPLAPPLPSIAVRAPYCSPPPRVHPQPPARALASSAPRARLRPSLAAARVWPHHTAARHLVTPMPAPLAHRRSF